MHPRDLASTFRASVGHSVNFCQLSVHPQDHVSNFRVSVGHSVNFSFFCDTFRQVWSTLRVSAVPTVNFCQHFVRLWDLPKQSVRLLDLPSTSVNYLCGLGTLCQLSVHLRDLRSTFCASAGSSINFQCGLGTFRQHFCDRGTFCQPQSTFNASVGPLVNFLCGCGTFRQHSLWLEDHSSTFPSSAGLSVHLGLSVHPRDFTSIFHAYVGLSISFHQLSVHPGTFCKLT